MRDLISIIIPVYNVNTFIEECLESVIRQTYTYLEIILIDDGSSDGCSEICDLYKNIDSRIKVVHQKNKGLSAARNKGITIASGKYLVFVDSDDYIDCSMIEKLYNKLLESNADLAICSFEYVYSDTTVNINKQCYNPLKEREYKGSEWIDELFHDYSWYYIVAWNKLYKKELWNKIRYPQDYIHEDEAVIHRILKKCNKIITIEDKLYYYRQHSQSVMQDKSRVNHLDKYYALADRLVFMYDDLTCEKRRFLCNMFWENYMHDYYRFLCEDINGKYVKRMKKSLIKVLPIFKQVGFFSKIDMIGILLFLISPKVYYKRYILKDR